MKNRCAYNHYNCSIVLLYKYIILLCVHLYMYQCTVINKNKNDKARDKVIDKLQLDGNNVINIKQHL